MMEKTVDIEKILKGKMGDKSKFVPSALVNWLKKIAHEDQVNKFLWDSKDLKGTPWLEACVKYLEMDLHIEGMENLPAKDDGRLYTIVSNHPLGGIDGVALGSIIGRHYDSRFRYLVNDLLMNLPTGARMYPHKQDRQAGARLPRYGRGRISEQQSHVDVPCRNMLKEARRRNTRHTLEEDVHH